MSALLVIIAFVAMHTTVCQRPVFLKIYTSDKKFLCQGMHYDVFPTLPNDVEIVECQSQSFTKFPAGIFKKKTQLLTVDVSNGSLQTLDKDTFEGAKSLQYFNADHSNLQGEIPRETFCDHTPDLRFVNLSNNPNYVFTSKPFECLKKLDALWIDGTIQNCDPDTVKWIQELPPDKLIVGDTCSSPMPVSPSQDCSYGGWIAAVVILAASNIGSIIWFNRRKIIEVLEGCPCSSH